MGGGSPSTSHSDLAPTGTSGVLSSVSTVLVVSPLPLESLLLCHCQRVLSLPPCPGSVSERATADVPANSMWDGLSCRVEVCAQRPGGKELHVRGRCCDSARA